MKRQIMLLSACTVALLSACSSNTRIANEVYAPAAKNELRAPATPLVTIDPYTSALVVCRPPERRKRAPLDRP